MDWEKFQHFKAELAKDIGCDLSEVEAVFGPLTGYQLWSEERAQSGQAGRAAIEANAYASIIATAKNEYRAIHGKPFEEAADDQLAGIIKNLRILEGAALAPLRTAEGNIRKSQGRKNLRAQWIADKVAEVFTQAGRNVAAGQDHQGNPSGPYGKAVVRALHLLEINANWRRPAEAAANKIDNTNGP